MCGICGCSSDHDHDHPHPHPHPQDDHHLISIEQNLLDKNNQFAQANRHFFSEKKVMAINLMSSPGSGKTTLLTKTLTDLKSEQDFAVIVADQQTDYDAQKIKTSGVEAVQINTGKGCHLDAHRLGHAAEKLSLPAHSILFIENVGNLVCPALFDLGEQYRVVILSVTEGDNKPLKYPDMFRKADLMLITKIDLLPYVDFDVHQCIEYAKRINPSVMVSTLSAKTGHGLNEWYQWLKDRL